MHLVATDIRKSFDTGRVVGPLSLEVTSGEALCLFGPSGTGKTTVLRMLAGLETPADGRIELDGKAVLPNAAATPGDIGMVFQEPALWPHMTVRQHLHFVLKPLKLGREACAERVVDCLAAHDLGHVAVQRPHLLSGGEQRRLSLARALVTNAQLLLLDEPFTHLDSTRVDRALTRVRERKESGAAVVFTTHIERERDALATRVLTLSE